MNVTYRQLKGFLLLARLGSFTRAAQQLHITQAGLSAMVRELEQQFDCRLFDRTTRSVSLTPEGAALIAPAEIAVGQIDAARTSMSASVSASRRILTIAVTPIFAAILAPAVCRAFAEVEPDVDVRIKDVPRREIQPLVERGEADVGFALLSRPVAGIEQRALLKFQLLYVAPAGTLPLENGDGERTLRRLPWARLPPLPLISLSAEAPIQAAVEPYLVAAGLPSGSRQTCNSMHTVLGMVAAGFGAAILPSMVLPSCPRQQYDVARLTSPVAHLAFYQMTRKGHRLSPSAAPFARTLQDTVKRSCAAQVV